MSELRRYVPGTALSWPGSDLLDDTGLHRHVDGTLVFVDVSGFTALSERLAQRGKVGAEQLTDVLNSVFGTMLGLAGARGGSLLKFGGDALFLLFTGPDHSLQAAAATVEMRSALAATAKTPGPAGRLRLRMSVGVHSGEVDLFLVGSSHRELVIVGPATTAVAEMEAAASAGQILIGPATAAALPSSAVGEALGPGYLLRWRRPHAPLPEPRVQPGTGLDVARFVPTALRELLGAGDPESEHRTVGVSFIRYTGIDALLHEHGHQATADALHTLVSASQESADAEGVTFLATDLAEDGGKVILVGGFPRTAEDDQGRLLRATRTIVQRSVDESWPIAVRGGLNRGHVFAGAIGSAERATVTVMGDTVNLAARVMAKADPGTVLATPATLDNAQTLFATEPVEPFMVKGKSRPVNAYVVGSETGTRPPRGLGTLPFLGRDEELGMVREAIVGLRDGKGQVATLLGEAGMGKTRLMREALRTATDATVLESRAEPYGVSTPYRPVRDPLRRLLGLSVTQTDGLAQTLVLEVSRLAPDLVPWLPLLGDVVGVPLDDTDATRDLDPKFRPDRTADAVISLIESVVRGPLIVTFDDTHYSDDATANLAARFEREAATRPWLLLTARRDDERGYRASSGHRVPLAPLTDETVRDLVLDATAAAPLRPHDVEAVVSRVAGNPLFLEETLRSLREHGDVNSLPSSLEGMVAAQIDSLSPLARRVVRRASVLGRSFRVAVLQDLFEAEDVILDDATTKSLAEILEPDGKGRLRFRHALLRDAAYDSLPYQRRREFHLVAARSTLRLAQPNPESFADNLALHTWMGGDFEQAWHWARIAGDRARATFANAEAVTQYQRALAAAGRTDVADKASIATTWEALGDSLQNLGRYADAARAFGSGRHATRDSLIQAQMLIKRARANERAQRHVAAYRDLTAARRLALTADGQRAAQLAATAAATRSYLLTLQDRYIEAEHEAKGAIKAAVACNADFALARALMALDASRTLRGQSDRGTYWRRALPIYEQIGDLEGQSTTMSNLGAIAYFDGRWDEAARMYRDAAGVASRMGDVSGAAITESNLGEVLLNQGHYEEAEPVLVDAVRVLTSTGLVADAGFAAIHQGRLMAAQGRHHEAADLLDSWRAELLRTGHPDFAFAAATAQAENLLAIGDPDEALAVLSQADHDTPDVAAVLQPMALRARAAALATLGENVEAAAVAEAGLSAAREQDLRFEAALLLASVAHTDPTLEPPAASERMDRAARELAALGVTQTRIAGLIGSLVPADPPRDAPS